MASVISDPNGTKRISFFNPAGERKTLWLGQATKRQAGDVAKFIESILIATTFRGSIPPKTAEWLNEIQGDPLYGKLADLGLVAARGTATLGGFIGDYITSRKADTRPNTQVWYEATKKALVGFFGADKPMREITTGDVDEFRLSLIGGNLAENTIRRRLGIARQFFKAAIRKGLLDRNPFADVAVSCQTNHDRFHYVTREDIQKILNACPNPEWKAIIALSRFGGLRAPSEILALQWQHVNWAENRLIVPQPKMETRGKPTRTIPLFPEVKAALLECFEAAEPGTIHVITRYRDASVNLRTQFERIILKAGVDTWPKPFQNMRSTRETELASEYPLHVVCAWIGNTEPVASKHYLQITSKDFERASGGGNQTSQNPSQQGLKSGVNPLNVTEANNSDSADLVGVCGDLQSDSDTCISKYCAGQESNL